MIKLIIPCLVHNYFRIVKKLLQIIKDNSVFLSEINICKIQRVKWSVVEEKFTSPIKLNRRKNRFWLKK